MLTRKLVVASLIALVAASASAKDIVAYSCDAQAVVFDNGSVREGATHKDAGTIVRVRGEWKVTVTNGGTYSETFLPLVSPEPVRSGLPEGSVHFETTQDVFDFVPEGNVAYLYATDTTGTGNQLRLTCRAK